MDDRLYRSVDERMLAGVAGGVAERLDADPSIVRIVWALLVVLTGGIALIAYVIMAIVVPEDPGSDPTGATFGADPGPDPGPDAAADPDSPTAATEPSWLASDAGGAAGFAALAATPPPSAGAPAAAAAPAPPPAGAGGTSGTWIAPDGRPVSRAEARRTARRDRRSNAEDRGPLVAGLILVLIGAFFLFRQFIPAIDLGSWWPIVLVGIGVILVIVSVMPGRRPD